MTCVLLERYMICVLYDPLSDLVYYLPNDLKYELVYDPVYDRYSLMYF